MAYFKCSGLNPTGNAAVGDVLSGKTFSNDSGIDKTGTMPNNGAVSATLNASTTSYTVPAGYHNGNGTVSISTQSKSASSSTSAQTINPDSGKVLSSVSIAAISPQRSAGTAATYSGVDSTGPFVYFPYGWWPNAHATYGCYTRLTATQAVACCPSQTKTITSSRSAQTVTPDSGKLLSSVTVNGLSPTGTYTASSRGASLDMGATSNYRYVNTNSVPNTNSGTYTFASGDTGGTKDLGAANTYRYVNAANVYAKGKADGSSDPSISNKRSLVYGVQNSTYASGSDPYYVAFGVVDSSTTNPYIKSISYDIVVSYQATNWSSAAGMDVFVRLYLNSSLIQTVHLDTIAYNATVNTCKEITGTVAFSSAQLQTTQGSIWMPGYYTHKTELNPRIPNTPYGSAFMAYGFYVKKIVAEYY